MEARFPSDAVKRKTGRERLPRSGSRPYGSSRNFVSPGNSPKPVNRDFRDLLAEFNALSVGVLSKEDLMRNKRAAGRAQDLADIEWLLESGGGEAQRGREKESS